MEKRAEAKKRGKEEEVFATKNVEIMARFTTLPSLSLGEEQSHEITG